MSEITKHALEDSLKVLLLRKPFNKITIGDLTKECGINRMTFYYHFTDMHHLLSWIILDEIHQLLLDTNIYPEGFIRLLYKMKESPELLSDKMNEIMDGCIHRALKRFEIHQN